jgi:hypothetical protein
LGITGKEEMKRAVIAILLFITFATIVEAAQVHSYTRRDGTYVSGYNTGSDRAFGKDIGVTIEAIVAGVGLVVGVIWWLASAASNQNSSRFDARLAQQREQEGVFREQVRRAQMQLEAEKNNPVSRGLS